MAYVYFPMLLMLTVGFVLAVILFLLATLAGPKNPTPEKLIPYESGSETEGALHVRLGVKFYLTAILFVVFDIEAVFLYPWATTLRELGWLGFIEMLSFLTVLTLTLVYAWRKGALEWEH